MYLMNSIKYSKSKITERLSYKVLEPLSINKVMKWVSRTVTSYAVVWSDSVVSELMWTLGIYSDWLTGLFYLMTPLSGSVKDSAPPGVRTSMMTLFLSPGRHLEGKISEDRRHKEGHAHRGAVWELPRFVVVHWVAECRCSQGGHQGSIDSVPLIAPPPSLSLCLSLCVWVWPR